jgi:hypothetical protein
MKTLAACSVAVGATWAILYTIPAPIPPATAWYDKAIVFEFAIAFVATAVVMLISRKIWTIRAIGLFFASLAVGLLFSNAVYVRQSGYHVNDRGRVVPATNPGVQEGISDLARALLMIGGPLLVTGLIFWLWGRFGPHHDPILDPEQAWPRIDRRRNPYGRRREDGKGDAA